MFNEEVILTIAQAILANTKVIQSLVDHLPAEMREKVASVVSPVAPVVAPVAVVIPKPAPIQAAPVMATPAPVVIAAPAPVVVSPSSPVMPAPPAFMAAPVVASAPAAFIVARFTDGKGLIDYVMSAYKALGAAKGANIQGVLTGMGYQNINDVKPEHYAALFAGVEALK
jgi:hypothetical protein